MTRRISDARRRAKDLAKARAIHGPDHPACRCGAPARPPSPHCSHTCEGWEAVNQANKHRRKLSECRPCGSPIPPSWRKAGAVTCSRECADLMAQPLRRE